MEIINTAIIGDACLQQDKDVGDPDGCDLA
jgi:hypothetical protein